MEFPNNITIDRLRYFTEAARQEHIGRASKVLHVSPSVISSAVRDLEEEFDLQLFFRERQTIKLNNDGRRMLEYAEEILQSVKDLKSKMNSTSPVLRGHYRIGASHFLMDQYLVPAILKLQAKESQITVEFSSLDSGVAIAQMQAGMLDAALIFRSSYVDKLDETILWKGKFKIVVKKDHPILKQPIKKRIEVLNNLPAISFRTSSGPNYWEKHPALLSAGITPKHTYFYDDTKTAVTILEQTDGWAFMPDFLINSSPTIKVVSLSNPVEVSVNVSLVTNETQRARQAVEKLKPILLINKL
jgi:DNA-binding transcriptional LysR family regulator